MKKYLFTIALLIFAGSWVMAQTGSLVSSFRTTAVAYLDKDKNERDSVIINCERAAFFTETEFVLYDSGSMRIIYVNLVDGKMHTICPGIGKGFIKKFSLKNPDKKKNEALRRVLLEMAPGFNSKNIKAEDLGEKEINGLACKGEKGSLIKKALGMDNLEYVMWIMPSDFFPKDMLSAIEILFLDDWLAAESEISFIMSIMGITMDVTINIDSVSFSTESPSRQVFDLPQINYVSKSAFNGEYRRYKESVDNDRHDNPGQTFPWNVML